MRSAQLAQVMRRIKQKLTGQVNAAEEHVFVISMRDAITRDFLDEINDALDAHEAEQALVALTAENQRLGLYDEAAPQQDPDKLDAERYRWLQERERWASVRVDFDRDSIYNRHRVVWYSKDGWNTTEGQSLDEAIDEARKAQP